MAESAGFPQLFSFEVQKPTGEPPAGRVTISYKVETTVGPRFFDYDLGDQTAATMQAAVTGAYDDTLVELTAQGFTNATPPEDVDRPGFTNDADLPPLPDP